MRGLKALMGSAVTDSGPVAVTECGTVLKQAAVVLVEAAQREGALRVDVEAVEVLRLAHGVATAAELADGEGTQIRWYVSLLLEGLRARTTD